MMITKTFQYKGQMKSYFNKVANNPNIQTVYCYWCAETGYTVKYAYKKKA